MEFKDIFKKLQELKIPVAYRLFESAPQSIPFCVYYVENRHRYGADDRNMLERCTVTIELYSNKKEMKLEDKIMNLFKEYEIEVYESYISEEKMLMNTFSFDYIKKL